MLEKKTIARPYAQAAYEQASEEGNLGPWAEALSRLAVICADEQMQSVLNDPRVSDEQLRTLVLDILGDTSQTISNFVTILVQADRLILAEEISELYSEMKAIAEKRIDVQVRTAYELDDSEKQKIADAVSSKLGRSVDLAVTEDKDLIGGAVVKAGDVVIDLSIRGRLSAMASEFS